MWSAIDFSHTADLVFFVAIFTVCCVVASVYCDLEFKGRFVGQSFIINLFAMQKYL